MSSNETTWRTALSAFPGSWLTLKKYCLERDLNYSRARYWRRRLAISLEDSTALSFALVQLPNTDKSHDSGVAVECGNHRVCLSSQFDESVLLRVVALLSNAEN